MLAMKTPDRTLRASLLLRVATRSQPFGREKLRSITLHWRQARRSNGWGKRRVGLFEITGKVPRAASRARTLMQDQQRCITSVVRFNDQVSRAVEFIGGGVDLTGSPAS